MKKLIFFSFFLCNSFLALSSENIVSDDTEKSLEDGGVTEYTEENEEDFSFNFDETDDEKNAFSVSIGGAIYTGISPFFNDFKKFSEVHPSSLVWGNLHLNATAPLSQAFISVNLSDQTLPFNLKNKAVTSKKTLIPRWIDEVFLQATVGSFYFSGGIKKVSWGKADIFSILDVVNPRDKSFFAESLDYAKMSIPMFQFVIYMPHDVKLESIFLPIFEPDLFAIEGRWKPYSLHLTEEKTKIKGTETLLNIFDKDTAKLGYSHGGARLTTTIAQTHDLGFQYFYGYTKQPVIAKDALSFSVDYLPLHNIGLDYATVMGHLNLRSELCTNIIGYEYAKNSNIEWNVGFDVGLTHGLSLNFLIKETIWFSSISKDEDVLKYAFFRKPAYTDTLALISLSQTILRGALEWKLLFVSCFESVDFAIVPSVHVIFGSIILDAKIGIFLGKDDIGIYSQYNKNNFLKLSLGYEF